MEVNGKFYSMWGQIVKRKEEWIGGTLEDFGDSFDRSAGISKISAKTKITNIELKPSGEDSAWFEVSGEDFTCGSNVAYLGIAGQGSPGWLTFSGYGGHTWRIQREMDKDMK